MRKVKDIYTRTLNFINEKTLVSRGDRILLAISGGKDSMALLDIFMHLRQKIGIDIGVFHLNHMMRGAESDGDEAFISDMAEKNGLPLFVKRFDFSSRPGGVSFEEFAREKRYEFLDQISRENGFNLIATAHSRDDNAETILMRIFSGTGIYGLRGIDAKRANIIRPILFLSSKEIYAHLSEKCINWREDSSNKENKYLRNYLRNSILPILNERFTDAEGSLLSLSGIAEDYTSLINDLLSSREQLYIIEENSVIIDKDRYISDKRLFNFVVSKVIRENFGEFVTRGVLDEIYKNALTEKSNLILYNKKGLQIKKSIKKRKKVIVISGNIEYNYNRIDWEYIIDLSRPGMVFIKEINRQITYNIVDYNYYLNNKGKDNTVFVSISGDQAVIRNRRSGDRIKLEKGVKKIKDLMIDSKLDYPGKTSIPLLVASSQVAAYMAAFAADVPNRVSVDFYVSSSSKKILAIQSGKYQE